MTLSLKIIIDLVNGSLAALMPVLFNPMQGGEG